ncbi:hypothetical protein [Phosphitispora sp. TUW77]|uniref:hypothetical protein n=1 Tax=Phosphitispora sp. TUW77 TaxID=3152361 RepID=UPI003AB6C51C
MKQSDAVALRPGYISGYEAIRRIAAVMTGSGTKHEEAGWKEFCFIAETDGKFIIENEVLKEIKKLPYIKLEFTTSCFVRKNEILANCRITDKIVPEYNITQIELLLSNRCCLLTVQPLEIQLISVSKLGSNNLSKIMMLIQ